MIAWKRQVEYTPSRTYPKPGAATQGNAGRGSGGTVGRRSSASLLKAVKDSGRRTGIVVTEDDKRRIAMLARWYSLSPDHIARDELDERIWNPDLNPNPTEEDRAAFASKVYAVKRRLAKLSRVEESGTHIGPLVGGGRFDYTDSTWFATQYGATAVELPWKLRSTINPQQVRHAWFAADVGMQIERFGHTVVSERELSTAVTVEGEELALDFNSAYVNPSSGVTTNKKPDVAVMNSEQDKFIAIEVENDKNRSRSTYTEKLKAYDSNPRVAAVWYLCSSQTTANRVGSAASSLFGTGANFPLRIRVIDRENGWMGIERLPQDERLMTDLGGMR